jgi:Fe-S-cluster containining protein
MKNLEKFKCQNCGICCRWGGSVLLTEEDISSLSSHLGLSETVFIEKYTRLAPNRIQLALLDQADGSCVFLKGNDCEVYSARPRQCRTFPFLWRVPSGCPGLDLLKKET